MIIPNTSTSTPAAFPADVIHQTAAIFRDVILPSRYAGFAADAPDSPPESMLAFALSVVLDEPIRSGAMELNQRVIIRHSSLSASYYEIDIVLKQTSTWAEAWIDPSSWRFKDRSEAEFEFARRRQRELMRLCPHYLPFSTSEVTRDLWGCCLEVVERIGTSWTAFEPLDQMEEIIAYLRRRGPAQRSRQAVVNAPDEAAAPDEASELLLEIQRTLASLPRAEEVQGRDAQEARRAYSRSHERYGDAECELLRRAAHAGMTVPRMASAFQRSPRAIEFQLARLGILAT